MPTAHPVELMPLRRIYEQIPLLWMCSDGVSCAHQCMVRPKVTYAKAQTDMHFTHTCSTANPGHKMTEDPSCKQASSCMNRFPDLPKIACSLEPGGVPFGTPTPGIGRQLGPHPESRSHGKYYA